jgi:hypothetical protein
MEKQMEGEEAQRFYHGFAAVAEGSDGCKTGVKIAKK